MQVYVSKGDQQYGPYTVEQLQNYLREGHFTPSDAACFDGSNWVTIGQVPGLSAGIRVAKGHSPTAQVPAQKRRKRHGRPNRRSRSGKIRRPLARASSQGKKKIILWSSIGAVAALLVIGFFLFFFSGGNTDKEAGDEVASETHPSAHSPKITKPISSEVTEDEDNASKMVSLNLVAQPIELAEVADEIEPEVELPPGLIDLADSWVGYTNDGSLRYTLTLKRKAGSNDFAAVFTLPKRSKNYANHQNFKLLSIGNGIVVFERSSGHVYRAKLVQGGTKMIEGTRGNRAGDVEPKFVKWELSALDQ